MTRPLLNLDAGERDDEPAELWQLVDVLAIACGGHAGDAASMARVIAACPGQQLGAHPSYPDREGFGRRSIAIAHDALATAIEAQCAALAVAASSAGRRVLWVKPHGALYHDAARSQELAETVLGAARAALGDAVGVIGPPRGALHDVAAARGLRYLREGFADRALRPDGSLVPRGEPGALIVDPAAAAAQAQRLAADHDTICMHADTPGALAIARAVREALGG
ncbi:MAG TPA: LamB/YcsF family protein [Kofleriaceae bacterium]|nr:LamB/YcsF family protein [Kofleriaceae bacterium]